MTIKATGTSATGTTVEGPSFSVVARLITKDRTNTMVIDERWTIVEEHIYDDGTNRRRWTPTLHQPDYPYGDRLSWSTTGWERVRVTTTTEGSET